MTRAQRFHLTDGAITPRAPAAQAATGDRFLVLLEGSQTERRYLDDLCGKLNLTAENVVIDSPDSDPLRLVQEAIIRREIRRKEAAKKITVEYNQIWVVCDRERQHHHRFARLQEACWLAREEGVHVALSIPTFEFWLLLHRRKHSAIIPDCPEAEALLSQVQGRFARSGG